MGDFLRDRVMKCFLHIGTYKTGSSAIQETFYDNCPPSLLFFYERVPNSSQLLSRAYETDANHLKIFHPRKPSHEPEDRIRFMRRLDAAVAQAQGKEALLISAERLFSMSTSSLASLRDDMRARFSSCRVIGYIRPPASYLASAFQQILKQRHKTFDLSSRNLDAEPSIQRFHGVFGKENVEYRIFDRAALKDGDVVTDILDRMGIEGAVTTNKTANESLSLEGVALLFAIRALAGKGNGDLLAGAQANPEIVLLCRAIGRRKFQFGKRLLAPHLEALAESGRRVCAEIGYPYEKFMEAPSQGVESEDDFYAVLGEPEVRREIDEYLKKNRIAPEVLRLVERVLRPEAGFDTEMMDADPAELEDALVSEIDVNLRRKVAVSLWQAETGKALAASAGGARDENRAEWNAAKPEMLKKAGVLIRKLEKRGVKLTVESGPESESEGED